MIDLEALEKSVQEIKNQEYETALKGLLNRSAEVLRSIVLELCEDDFFSLWVDQYRAEGRSFPCVERTTLLLIDTSYQIETAANKYQISVGKATKFYQGREATRDEKYEMRQIPDKVFLPIVAMWLNSLSASEKKKIIPKLVGSMDTSACAASILDTKDTVTGERVLLPRLVRKYGTEFKRLPYFKEKLKFFKENRNIYAHLDKITLENMSERKLFGIVEELKDLIISFAKSEDAATKEAILRFNEYIQDDMERLRLPAIVIEDFERQYQLPQGKLAPALASFRELRGKMDGNHTVILFTPEAEIKQYYSAYTYDFDAAREMKAKPESIVLDVPKTLEFRWMKEYRSGKMSANQVDELASQFVMLLDLETLLSETAMKMVAKMLGPAVKKYQRCLLVDWGTLSHLYRTEKDAEDKAVRKQAHDARLQLYHMQKMGLIRYVGSMDHHIDPAKSLLEFVRGHQDAPICVITANRMLAAQLSTIETPNCLTLTNWRDEGLMVRTISKNRLAAICEVGLVAEKGAEQVEAEAKQDKAEEVKTESLPVQQSESEQITVAVPDAGSTVWDESGEPVQLVMALGQPGGEGTVYRTSRPGVVAKIYHADQVNRSRQEKLEAMRMISVDHDCICWPKSLLYTEDKHFVGFLMAEAPRDVVEMGISIFKLGGEHVQKQVLPGWDRRSLARACVSVSSTFAYLHRRSILMGDVNPRNLLVSPSNPDKVYFVDCDSYQVGKYVCPVGMAEYSSPEILKRLETVQGGYANCPRTIEDEQFSLASLLFHIIMLGQTPFAAKNNEKIEEAIRTYSFAYRTKTNRGADVPDGPYALIWNNTPPYIRDKFAAVFTGQEKFSAEAWCAEFQRYIGGIASGRSSAELLPRKYFDATGTFFRDFICVGCKEESNMPAEKHERLVKYNQPLLCNRCMSLLWPMQEQPAMVICDSCHRTYSGTKYDKAMQEYGKRCKCPACKERGNTMYGSSSGSLGRRW